jgi:phosphoglycerate dehydrogenase-like enzyme
MKKLAILATDEWLKDPGVLAQLRDGYEVLDYSDWRQWDGPTMLAKLRAVEVVVTGRHSPSLPAQLAGDFGNLRWLLHLYGTVRHLAAKSLVEAGLIVTNWGEAVAGVAEGAMALVLCMLKQLVTLNARVQGEPDRRIHQAYGPTLEGRDVGLYGFGPIGRHMARMLAGFGPKIAIYDPYATDVPEGIRVCKTLRELFATCQIISLHCGLNDQTRGSVTAELLALLPQGGIVVNTARGAVVDEEALASEVAAGRLLAGIDVICHEGRWKESPLAGKSGAILTGHNVGGGKGYPPGQAPAPRLPDFAVKNLRAYREGSPLIHVVTAAEYDLKT